MAEFSGHTQHHAKMKAAQSSTVAAPYPAARAGGPAHLRGLRGFGARHLRRKAASSVAALTLLIGAVMLLSLPGSDAVRNPHPGATVAAAPEATAPSPQRPPAPPATRVRPDVSPDADVSVVLRELATEDERSVADLAALLDTATAPSLRRSAARLLAEMGTPSAVAALLHAIATAPKDQPPVDLLAALDSLENQEAAPALSAFLLQAKDAAVAAPVRDALARLADAAGVLEIVTTLRESAVERWQQANLEGALLNVRAPAAVPVLRDVLLRDSNPTLRRQAATALAYIGGADSAAALATALATSRSPALTAAVTESLALLKERATGSSSRPP